MINEPKKKETKREKRSETSLPLTSRKTFCEAAMPLGFLLDLTSSLLLLALLN